MGSNNAPPPLNQLEEHELSENEHQEDGDELADIAKWTEAIAELQEKLQASQEMAMNNQKIKAVAALAKATTTASTKMATLVTKSVPKVADEPPTDGYCRIIRQMIKTYQTVPDYRSTPEYAVLMYLVKLVTKNIEEPDAVKSLIACGLAAEESSADASLDRLRTLSNTLYSEVVVIVPSPPGMVYSTYLETQNGVALIRDAIKMHRLYNEVSLEDLTKKFKLPINTANAPDLIKTITEEVAELYSRGKVTATDEIKLRIKTNLLDQTQVKDMYLPFFTTYTLQQQGIPWKDEHLPLFTIALTAFFADNKGQLPTGPARRPERAAEIKEDRSATRAATTRPSYWPHAGKSGIAYKKEWWDDKCTWCESKQHRNNNCTDETNPRNKAPRHYPLPAMRAVAAAPPTSVTDDILDTGATSTGSDGSKALPGSWAPGPAAVTLADKSSADCGGRVTERFSVRKIDGHCRCESNPPHVLLR